MNNQQAGVGSDFEDPTSIIVSFYLAVESIGRENLPHPTSGARGIGCDSVRARDFFITDRKLS